ncbi:MAG: transposase [Planctomycetes bacterium]|nr:transposase [Planctomycetota bacterium]
MKRHQDEVFTFLRNADVPFDNNFGERSIRFAVIMRKNSFNNFKWLKYYFFTSIYIHIT